MIITSIINFYTKLNSDNTKIISILNRYLNETEKLNRALNKE